VDRQVRDVAAAIRTTNPDVILLTGVTNRQRCDHLATVLKSEDYRVAVCSGFRNAVPARNVAQVAILSRGPVMAARAETWRNAAEINTPGGFAYAVIRQGTNSYYCYAVQMPGDPGYTFAPNPVNSALREQCARYLLAHAARLETDFPNRHTATILAGDFHSDALPEAAAGVGVLLEQYGFQSVFANVAMPKRFAAPPLTDDTLQFFDTVLARGADFFSVPHIGGTKLSRYLPVSSELAMKLDAPRGPGPIVQVDWPRLGGLISTPYRSLPAAGRRTVIWGVPGLLIGGLGFLLWRFWRNRRLALKANPTAPAISGHAVAQIGYPRPTGDSVYVGESVDVRPGPSRDHAPSSEALLWQMRALEAEERARHAQEALRAQAAPNLLRMMRDKVLTMLGAQRAQLIESHETGTRHVLQLEQRLEQLHSQFQDNLRARDRRIAELQEQLAAHEQAPRDGQSPPPRNSGKQIND
jgi:hypothetical protein